MFKNKTIKFFISSTFKDFEAERNILQKFVFPKLKELCNKNGFGFQPIDLRWGIQEEAGLDQQTMNICLNEIKRSSHEPRPNLLILVGQRYGWIPLPYELKKDEFKIIINSNKILDEDKNLINCWYEEDENSIENIYYLKNKHHLTREEWNEIEEQIRVSFQKVFDNPKDEDIYRKYNTSATEQEMYLGLDKFQKEVDNSHTFAYFRKIINYNDEDVTDYIDKDLTKLKKLWKKLRINSNIPKKNQVRQKNVQWNEIKQSNSVSYNELNLEKVPFYLKEFYDQILEKFTISIEKEINNFQEQTQLQIELEQQENFLKEKSEKVLGRDVEVERILGFIKNDNEQFYLQYGKSGSGKTSVMAKAISEINTKEYEVYYRFIGTTANSTYSRILFENIFWEIEANLQNKNDLPKPNIEIKEREFKKQFKLQFEKLNKKKVVIFLDALDQFEDYNDLTILLDNLPSNIKIVFSTLYDENKKDNSDYSEYFNRLSYLKNKYELLPLGTTTNKKILKKLLESQNRKLTIKQWKEINSNLQNITPLHLRLIFEIVKHWKSKQNNLHLKDTEEKLIIQFFEFIVKQYHHEKELLELSFGYIAASKDGLSEEELLDLFSNDKKFLELFQNHRYPSLNKLPNAIWSRFYYYVQNIFTEKLIDGQMLIKPYHRIIEEVIKENFYKKNAKQLHKELSDYFYLKQDKNKNWNQRYHNLHMLSEYPYQLFHSKQFKELKEILFDLEFAGSVYDNNKQDSFRDIISKATQLDNITEDEIYPWESFYREKEHLILRVNEEFWKPHQSLFQLAYEDGENSPLTIISNDILSKDKINWIWIKNENILKLFERQGLSAYSYFDDEIKLIKILNDKYIVVIFDVKVCVFNNNLKIIKEVNISNIQNIFFINDGLFIFITLDKFIIFDIFNNKLIKLVSYYPSTKTIILFNYFNYEFKFTYVNNEFKNIIEFHELFINNKKILLDLNESEENEKGYIKKKRISDYTSIEIHYLDKNFKLINNEQIHIIEGLELEIEDVLIINDKCLLAYSKKEIVIVNISFVTKKLNDNNDIVFDNKNVNKEVNNNFKFYEKNNSLLNLIGEFEFILNNEKNILIVKDNLLNKVFIKKFANEILFDILLNKYIAIYERNVYTNYKKLYVYDFKGKLISESKNDDEYIDLDFFKFYILDLNTIVIYKDNEFYKIVSTLDFYFFKHGTKNVYFSEEINFIFIEDNGYILLQSSLFDYNDEDMHNLHVSFKYNEKENQLIGYLKDRGNFVIIDLLRNKISKNYTLNSHIEDLLIINNYVIYKSDIFIYYYNFKTNTFKLKIPLFLAGNYNFEIINLKKYSVKRFEFLTNTIRSINYKLEFGIFFKDFIK